MKKCCVECAVILCDCGAYHGTDGVVIVDAERGPLYAFASAADEDEDAQCDGYQYALCDDAVDRLSPCARCEREDAYEDE